MRRSQNAKVGDIAGTMHPDGYIHTRVNGKFQLVHRIIWLYVNGKLPHRQIDHINGVRTDNRISNLRLVTNKQNSENRKLHSNNTSGHRGVTWDKETGKWMVQIRHLNKRRYVGRFDNIEEAALAAKVARDQLFTHHNTEYSA